MEPRNRFRQAGNRFLGSLKGLQYKYGLRTCFYSTHHKIRRKKKHLQKKFDLGSSKIRGIFLGFFLFMYDIQQCFICRPSDSTVSEDAGIESRPVATTALAVRRFNHSARSHPHSARSHPHSARSHPHSARSHPHSARSHLHSARSHSHSARSHSHSARSHPQLG